MSSNGIFIFFDLRICISLEMKKGYTAIYMEEKQKLHGCEKERFPYVQLRTSRGCGNERVKDQKTQPLSVSAAKNMSCHHIN